MEAAQKAKIPGWEIWMSHEGHIRIARLAVVFLYLSPEGTIQQPYSWKHSS